MLHPFKIFLYFAVATLLLGILGMSSAAFSAPALLALAGTSIIVGGFSLGGGMGVTIWTRSAFSLMQTGRVIQWPAFCLSAWAGLALSSWLFGSLLTISAGFGSALAIFAGAFAWGYFRKEIPWKGRTWLPRRMPKK